MPLYLRFLVYVSLHLCGPGGGGGGGGGGDGYVGNGGGAVVLRSTDGKTCLGKYNVKHTSVLLSVYSTVIYTPAVHVSTVSKWILCEPH